MSIKSRSKNLKKATGWPLTRCNQVVRANAPAAGALAYKNQWARSRADVFVVDSNLDAEYHAARQAGRYLDERQCENCNALFFGAKDKKGVECFGADSHCPTCVKEYGGVWYCSTCGGETLGEQEALRCSDCWDRVLRED